VSLEPVGLLDEPDGLPSQTLGFLDRSSSREHPFKNVATLRVEPSLLPDVESLRWSGSTPVFVEVCHRLDAGSLAAPGRQGGRPSNRH
jgi:hypothetical protein